MDEPTYYIDGDYGYHLHAMATKDDGEFTWGDVYDCGTTHRFRVRQEGTSISGYFVDKTPFNYPVDRGYGGSTFHLENERVAVTLIAWIKDEEGNNLPAGRDDEEVTFWAQSTPGGAYNIEIGTATADPVSGGEARYYWVIDPITWNVPDGGPHWEIYIKVTKASTDYYESDSIEGLDWFDINDYERERPKV